MKTKSLLCSMIFAVTVGAGAAQAHSLECDPGQADTFNISIESKSKIEVSQGGGELGAEYIADESEDTSGYAAFKILPSSQDGEQPKEVKIARELLTGQKSEGFVWLAPGILGGSFRCKVSE